ncbi:MAG: CRTAC1 family protein [Pirellulales bacterium]
MSRLMGLTVATLLLWMVSKADAAETFSDKSAALGLKMQSRGTVAWADYDNDGFVDIYTGFTWKNNGGKGFTKLEHPNQGGGAFADFDNDGYLDRLSPDRNLYRSDSGTGNYTKMAFPELAVQSSMCQCWADLNNDGFVDLYIGGGAGNSQLDAVCINDAGKAFTAREMKPSLYTRGAAACDYDEDGDIDVMASRYWFQPNSLWQNDGKGNLSDIGGAAGVHGAGHTISSGWADFDNDGHFDIFHCNFNHHDNRRSEDAMLYKNLGAQGGWKFKNTGSFGGDKWQESFASVALGDYDNDGDVDVFITTVYAGNHARLFRNDGGWNFTNVTGAEGLGGIGTTGNYQAAWGDYDNDGDLDLVTDARLFENRGGDNHWVRVRLQGNGHKVNRAAIGAQVRIEVPDLGTLVRQVEGGTGQGNQNDLTLHFGLGKHESDVDLKVTWPDGSVQTVKTAVDRTVSVKQQ